MMNPLRSTAAGLVLAVAYAAANPVYAQASAPLKEPAAVKLDAKSAERFAAVFMAKTGMKPDTISVAPLGGFVEVIVGTSVFYMDHAGKWLIDGHLVDMDTRTSVTALKRQSLEAVEKPVMDWSTLNLTDAIKTTRGRAVPGRVLVTFEDPNCGFCKKLAGELDKLQDITIYTFPVGILGEASRAKNEAVWCAKDRAAAWKSALAGAVESAGRACDLGALTRNGELAARLRVTGTPTMFLADGGRIAGYMDAASIEKRLAQVATVPVARK